MNFIYSYSELEKHLFSFPGGGKGIKDGPVKLDYIEYRTFKT